MSDVAVQEERSCLCGAQVSCTGAVQTALHTDASFCYHFINRIKLRFISKVTGVYNAWERCAL